MLSVLKANLKIKGILLFAFFWGAALIPAAECRSQVLYKGIVTSHKLNIRALPRRGSAVVVILERGEEVDVLQTGDGDWLLVDYYGEQGYVRNRSRYITLIKPDELVFSPEPAKKAEPDIPPLKKRKAGLLEKKKKKNTAAGSSPDAIKQQIEKETLKVASFAEKETQILDELNTVEFDLNQARVRAAKLKRETLALTLEIDTIQGRMSELAKTLDNNKVYTGHRLNALYRLYMMGSLEMAGPPASLFDFFVQQNALKQVVASDFDLLEKQTASLKELDRLETELTRQMASRMSLEQELEDQIQIREQESRKKAAILEGIRVKKELARAALTALRASATVLDDTLDGMVKMDAPVLSGALFVRLKGQLPMPVPGKIISSYGKALAGDYKSFTFQSGIDIRVRRGEPVRSVFKGEVMFAQWLKGYGNLVIINHGDSYYTLYAHVEELFKKKGEQVGTGEVIATAGDSGSVKGLCLHFEVRHHGKPVNPMKWLKKGA